MNCNLGDAFADNGFSFLEKLHSPIFLIHKNGSLKRVNEAGRKMLAIAQIDKSEISRWASSWMAAHATKLSGDSRRVKSRFKEMKLIVQPLESSDYFIAEVIR